MISIVRAPDFVYELVNPAFQSLAPGKQFLGRRFADVWAEVSDPLVEILQNVIKTGRTFQLEDAPYTIQRGPGAPLEVVYVSYSWIPLPGPDGNPDRILTLAHETTGSVLRRQAEEALRKSEVGLAEAQRISHIGSWEWDLKSNTIEWSDEMYRLFGLAHGAFDGKLESLLKLIHPDDRERFVKNTEDNRSRAVPLPLDFRAIRPDGTEVSLYAQAMIVFDDAGNPVKDIGTLLDITERRRMEEEVHAASLYARSLLEASLDPLVTISPGGQITDVNRATELVTGVPRERLIGSDFSDYFTEPERARAGYRKVLSDGLVRDYPLTIRHVSSRTTDVLYNATVYRNAAGEVQGVFAAARDVTERRRLEEKTKQLQLQIAQAQKVESIGRLAGGIAHDFNNLLTVINGYSQLLLAKLRAGDPLRAKLEEIHKAGERAAGLTRQLLAFSRRQVLQPHRLDLNRVVEEMRPMLERLVRESVEVRVELNAESATVYADPHQLEQVIMNLVVNARDAMPGGGRLLIETAVVELDEDSARSHLETRAGRYVMLAVSDSGGGMDEETRGRVFEPFFTTKGVGEGTGLGLSMVHGIVAQSGGYIDVASEPGVGTTFKIYLPALADAAVDAETPAAVPVLGGKETVLVVEDQAQVRDYTVEVLKAYGYRVTRAGNASEALLLCEREGLHIHLLLTDVVMPNASGMELAARLERSRPGIKVLFMSGYSGDVIARHGVLEEGAAFIQKPFSPEALAVKVRAVLGPPAPRILVADDEAGVRGFLRAALEEGGYEVTEAADGKTSDQRGAGGARGPGDHGPRHAEAGRDRDHPGLARGDARHWDYRHHREIRGPIPGDD